MRRLNGKGLSKDNVTAVTLFALFFLLPFAVHWRQLIAGEVPFANDGIDFIYGMQYLETSLKNGEIPFWTPYLAGGQPYVNGLSPFYPIRIFCCFLPGVVQPYFYFGIHYAIGGTAMYAYLRRLKCSRFVSCLVSVFYIFTAHMGGLRREHVSLIVTALYVPVVMFFLESYLEKQRIKWLLMGSAAMAVQFCVGFLQYVIYFDIFTFFYLLTGGLHRRMSWKRMLGHGSAWVAAYFGMIMGSALPLFAMMMFLSHGSGSSMGYGGFSSLSLHPGKLIMTIFPYFFGNSLNTGLMDAGNYSSAVDIELYLSAAAVSAILAALPLAKKDYRVRFMSVAGLVLLLYACMGQFPLLAEVLYKIPVLNMFRVCSRTLFLYTFCCVVLLALSAEELLRSKEHMARLGRASGILCAVSAALVALYPIIELPGSAEKPPMSKVFLLPLLMFALFLAVMFAAGALSKRGKADGRLCSRVVAAVLLLTGIAQLAPFFVMSNFKKYDEASIYPDELTGMVGNSKILVGIEGSELMVGSNGAIARQIATLDAYTNYNLPSLYKYIYHTDSAPMNSSGMYLFDSETVRNAARTDNEVLSMLGVRYLLFPGREELESLMAVGDSLTGKTLVEAESVELEESEGYSIAIFDLKLEARCYYRIALMAEGFDDGESFYVDLYGEDYDFPEQDHYFYADTEEAELETLLYSGDIPDAPAFFVRIVVPEDTTVELSGLRIEQLKPELQYEEAGQFGQFCVFENVRAKDLIYAADRVEPVSGEERNALYLRTEDFDLLNTAYITDGDESFDFSGSNMQVGEILRRNNSVSAQVYTEDGGFMVLSQSYYPGWRAYVDGRRVELFEVNGIIMGAFVPGGEHTLEFRYVPTTLFIGIALTLLTVAVCVTACAVSGRRRRKKEGSEA